MKKLSTLIAAAIALLGLISGAALAHQQKSTLIEVLFNERSGKIEIAHRYILHDAEYAVRVELGINGDLYTKAQTRADFAAYVADNFSLATPSGETLPLTMLGTEIDDGFLWVYQETTSPDAIKGLVVRSTALRDIWPTQVNRVNVKQGAVIKTVVFSDSLDEYLVEFEK